MQELPTSPGVNWVKKGKWFHKRLMKDHTSLKALQWLAWLQETSELLINKNGERVQIQHACNRGEVKFHDLWLVDGYANIDGNHLFF